MNSFDIVNNKQIIKSILRGLIEHGFQLIFFQIYSLKTRIVVDVSNLKRLY